MDFVDHLHGHCVMPSSFQMQLIRVVFLNIWLPEAHHGIMCFVQMLGGYGSTAKEQFHHLKSCIHWSKKSLAHLGHFWMPKQGNRYSILEHGKMLEMS